MSELRVTTNGKMFRVEEWATAPTSWSRMKTWRPLLGQTFLTREAAEEAMEKIRDRHAEGEWRPV